MRGIRYDPERRKGSTLPRRTDILATLARLAAACLAVAFALLLVPENAYAVTYGDVIYGPTAANGPTDSTSYYVQVYAFDRYTAALGALGYNPQDARFTSDVKAYLSNSTTGGAFYDFAQLFTDSPYENDGGSVVGGTVGVDVENSGMYFAYRQNVNLYGSNVWWANYTTTQSLAARTSIGLVLAGDIAGGGSGSTPEDYGTYEAYNGLVRNYRDGTATVNSNGVKFCTGAVFNASGCSASNWESSSTILLRPNTDSQTPETIQLRVSSAAMANLRGRMDDGDELLFFCGSTNAYVIAAPAGSYSAVMATYSFGGDTYQSVEKIHFTQGYKAVYSNSNVYTSGDGWYCCVKSGYSTSNYTGEKDFTAKQGYISMSGVTGGTPTPPPTNWPTDPTPTPPTDPTVPEPPTYGTPTQPTIPGPTADPIYGTQPVYVTNVFTADLQGVIDALDEHCKHLQNALYTNMSDFYTKLTTKMTNDFATLRSFLHGQFGWLGDGMVDIANDMMDYLHDLFVWLAEQFDFSVSGGGYDDNTVVAWLKKIYSKLGGGVNTRPTDPVSDPIGFGDWLNQLLQNFVLDLLAMGQNVLADLVESFRELITKFPFSIPWDIAAFLALLVAEPVAPSIDWPVYTVSGGVLTQVATCEIDLEDYDSVMGGVRAMETLLFACWLAFKIDFFKGVVSGIGGNK